MPVIVPQRRVWTRQPQQPVWVDASIIRPSLVILPPVKHNLINRAIPTLNGGGGISTNVSEAGNVLAFNGNASGGMQFTGIGGKEYTYIYHGSIETAGSRYARFFSDEAVSGNHLCFYDGDYINVENGARFTYTSSTKAVTLIITCSANSVKVWIDGVLKLNSSRGTLTYQNVCFFNRATDWQRQFKGSAALVAWVPQYIPNALGVRLSLNPWQIFKPRRRITYIDLGAGSTYNLTIAEASHSHAVDSLLFSSQDLLTVSDASHGQTADNLGLSTQWLLAVQDALHSQASDNLTLSTTGSNSLDVQEATHAHFAEQMALVTTWLLTIAEASHGHAADNVTLDASNATWLTVQDAGHAQSSDYLALSLDTWLAIVDAAHAHYADSPLLTAETTLAIAEALHAVYSDTAVLSLPGATSLTPDDIANIASAVLDALQAAPSTLTVAKFLGLK
jgi:hypothetical protein